jgi:hypothetical protein
MRRLHADDVFFSNWTSWHSRERLDALDDVPHDFGISGLYLLARFETPEDSKSRCEPFHLNPNIIYIGVSRSTIHRLGRNHGTVARYKSTFSDVTLSNLYCSVWQSEISNYEIQRGNAIARSFLLYVERKLIWEYTCTFDRLPRLNRA